MLPPSDRRLLVVVNPVAGGDRARGRLPAVRSALEGRDADFRVRWTGEPGDSERIAARGVKEGFTHVVALGGDGTVNGCANALAGTDATLAVVPGGSGNDFARAAGLPEEPAAAVRVALEGPSRAVDVGRLGGRRFANGLGLGLDGAVAHRVARTSWLRGEAGYVAGAVREALTFDPFGLRVETLDGAEEGLALLAGATNGPAHGGDFRIAPGADPADGLLDAYRFGPIGVLRRLRYLPRVRAGRHTDMDIFQRSRVPWATFTVDREVPAHMDGEVLTLEEGTHRVEVEAGALAVAVPGEDGEASGSRDRDVHP